MSRTWTPNPANSVTAAGLRIMHGGPAAMRLPEHEHPETQISVHFPSPSLNLLPRCEVIPPGCPHRGQWEDGVEVIVLLLPPSSLELAAAELLPRDGFEILRQRQIEDPLLTGVAASFRRQFAARRPVSGRFAESAGYMLAEHLLRTCSETRPQPIALQDRLSTSDLRRVTDFVDAHPAASIAEIGAACGMGSSRFTHVLKSTTGRTPHQFLLARRIHVARRLLKQSGLSLAEISYQLGFSSQSHFTAVFRRFAGITPHQFRNPK